MPVLISGEQSIEPAVEVKRAMVDAGQRKLTPSLKMCVGPDGVVSKVTAVTSSGYIDYDNALREAILRWRYQPLRVDGQPAPFCKQVSFVFRFTEPYWSATARELSRLHDGLIDQFEAASTDCKRLEEIVVTFARAHEPLISQVERELDDYERRTARETGNANFGVGFDAAFLRKIGRYVMPCANKDAVMNGLFAAGFRPAGPRR